MIVCACLRRGEPLLSWKSRRSVGVDVIVHVCPTSSRLPWEECAPMLHPVHVCACTHFFCGIDVCCVSVDPSRCEDGSVSSQLCLLHQQ